MKKKIKLGVDFDGVVSYNPFRLVRAPWALFKSKILGIKKLTFFYPEGDFQKFIWRIMHDSSIFPARGTQLLQELTQENIIETHLITGRFNFLEDHLYGWLDKYEMEKIFTSVNLNSKDEQPHLFKEEVIRQLGIDIFIEDNWDIVDYLARRDRKFGRPVKIFWIYNLIDRFRNYKYKYPYLEKALLEIKKSGV